MSYNFFIIKVASFNNSSNIYYQEGCIFTFINATDKIVVGIDKEGNPAKFYLEEVKFLRDDEYVAKKLLGQV